MFQRSSQSQNVDLISPRAARFHKNRQRNRKIGRPQDTLLSSNMPVMPYNSNLHHPAHSHSLPIIILYYPANRLISKKITYVKSPISRESQRLTIPVNAPPQFHDWTASTLTKFGNARYERSITQTTQPPTRDLYGVFSFLLQSVV